MKTKSLPTTVKIEQIFVLQSSTLTIVKKRFRFFFMIVLPISTRRYNSYASEAFRELVCFWILKIGLRSLCCILYGRRKLTRHSCALTYVITFFRRCASFIFFLCANVFFFFFKYRTKITGIRTPLHRPFY